MAIKIKITGTEIDPNTEKLLSREVILKRDGGDSSILKMQMQDISAAIVKTNVGVKKVIGQDKKGGRHFYLNDDGSSYVSVEDGRTTDQIGPVYLDKKISVGGLFYNKIPIEVIVAKEDSVGVAYLSLHGKLPDEKEKEAFSKKIAELACPDEKIQNAITKHLENEVAIIKEAGGTTDVASLIESTSNLLAKIDPLGKRGSEKERLLSAMRIMALGTVVSANAYNASTEQDIRFLKKEDLLKDIENGDFSFGKIYLSSLNSGKIYPKQLLAVEFGLVLQAHHGNNLSAGIGTTLLAGKYASSYEISAGMSKALRADRHGGASQAVIKKLIEVYDAGPEEELDDRMRIFMQGELDKGSDGVIPGMGHGRLNEKLDARVSVGANLIDALGISDTKIGKAWKSYIKIGAELVAGEIPKSFNVDSTLPVLYHAAGLPAELGGPLFDLSRKLGQWATIIMLDEEKMKLVRFADYSPEKIETGDITKNEQNMYLAIQESVKKATKQQSLMAQ